MASSITTARSDKFRRSFIYRHLSDSVAFPPLGSVIASMKIIISIYQNFIIILFSIFQ